MANLDVRTARPDQLVSGAKSDWEIIVGLEVHAQVTSNAKLFSGASAAYGGEPNAHVSLVDAAMPGMLPVINRFCVEQAIRTGLGLNAEIHRESRFDRKNYFYPDLPQGYQISQFQMPIVGEGEIEVEPDGEEPITIRIERLHLEQDAGKSIHDLSPTETFVDLNRSGVALMEIVSRPDMRSAKEAAAYFNKLRSIVRALGTCDGNMEEGSMRADVNVSVRRAGTKEWGTRCEIKNVNSTRFMMQAIEYESRRQIEILESGGSIDQETRLFDPDKGETRTMRSKEDAHDYRYFPDPDLLPLLLDEKWIEEIRRSLPELPDAEQKRYTDVKKLGLPAKVAADLLRDPGVARAYERQIWKWLVQEFGEENAVLASVRSEGNGEWNRWVCLPDEETLLRHMAALEEDRLAGGIRSDSLANHLGDIADNYSKLITQHVFAFATERQVDPVPIIDGLDLYGLRKLLFAGTISSQIAKTVMIRMMETGRSAEDIVEREGLKQVTDTGAIEKAIDDLMAANADKVADVQKNPKAFGWWVGQTMKATGGKANPGVVNEILKKKLGVS